MTRIDDVFADAPAFIPYLVAGDPGGHATATHDDPAERAAIADEATKQYVQALVRGGADVVELGLPFSEPIAEGPTIQNAIARSLACGMTPRRFFDLVAALDVDAPIVVMTYYNLIYRFGLDETDRSGTDDANESGVETFVARAAAVGIDGIIVPDLPVEESGPLREACEAHSLSLIFIVAPTTREDRLTRIMEQVSGYVYVQARLGITGARGRVSEQTGRSLDRIAAHEEATNREPIPKAVGFGVSTGEHAAEIVAAGADGVIVGSALVDVIGDDGTDVAETADALERLATELKSGAIAGLDRRGPRPERT